MTDAVRLFLDAARRRDVRRMYELVDWGVTGAARMTRALYDVEPPHRADLSERGLRELYGLPAHAFDLRLGTLALRLDDLTRIRPASSAEAAEVLDRLVVPAAPAGVPAHVGRFLEQAGRTVGGMSEVVALDLADGGSVLLVPIPGEDRVALGGA